MSLFLKLLFRNRLAAMGAVVLGAILLLVLITPILPLQNPDVTATADRFKRPFTEGHLFGTDHLGRDLLSRLLHGTLGGQFLDQRQLEGGGAAQANLFGPDA